MTSTLSLAAPAAIIRTAQKDEEFVSQKIRKELDELFQRLFGVRRWIEQRERLQILSQMLYFSMTTLSGLQTLGEEHTMLVMTKNGRIPSFSQRFYMIVAQCGTWILIKNSLNSLSLALDNSDQQLWPSILNRPDVRAYLYEHIPQARKAISILFKFNEALFYMNGIYLTLNRRLFGIQYAAMNPWMGDGTSGWLYKVLGYLSLTQLTMSFFTQQYVQSLIRNSIRKEPIQVDEEEKKHIENVCSDYRTTIAGEELKCSLCLLGLNNTTSTPCGHLFCWNCIHKWIQKTRECPLCRRPIEPSRLVFLQNV